MRNNDRVLFIRRGKHFQSLTGIAPTSQDYLVEQGVLRPPMRLSERINGWLYDDVEADLAAERDKQKAAGE